MRASQGELLLVLLRGIVLGGNLSTAVVAHQAAAVLMGGLNARYQVRIAPGRKLLLHQPNTMPDSGRCTLSMWRHGSLIP